MKHTYIFSSIGLAFNRNPLCFGKLSLHICALHHLFNESRICTVGVLCCFCNHISIWMGCSSNISSCSHSRYCKLPKRTNWVDCHQVFNDRCIKYHVSKSTTYAFILMFFKMNKIHVFPIFFHFYVILLSMNVSRYNRKLMQ